MFSMVHVLSLVKFVNEKSRCAALYVLYLDVISTPGTAMLNLYENFIVDCQ